MINDGMDAKLDGWIATLDDRQLRGIVFNTIHWLMETEDIRWSDEDHAPYWDTNGERVHDV